MVLFGSLMLLFGYVILAEWRSEGATLIACSVLWGLAGLTAVAAALWLVGSLGHSPLARRTGGTAMVVSGLILIAAAEVGVLPCSGPA